MAMNSHRRKIILYSVWSAAGSIAASVTIPMFGDGTLSWAEFRFSWVKLTLGVILSVSATLKAFYSDPENPLQVPPEAQASLARLDELAAWNDADKPA